MNVTFPAENLPPLALRTRPAISPSPRVTQGSFSAALNSALKTESSSKTQASSPFETFGQPVQPNVHSALKKTYDEVAQDIRIASIDKQSDTLVHKVSEQSCRIVRAVSLAQEHQIDLRVA